MSDSKPIIHIRIRELRREHSLTQEELAEALGVSRQSINAMEAGRCLPSLPLAMQLASYFSVPISVIFDHPEASAQMQNALLNPATEWTPLREMREALDELIDESRSRLMPTGTALPLCNIFQTGDEVVVQLAVPGFKKEDIALEIGEDFLAVSGSGVSNNIEYYRQEFGLESFERTIALPALVQTEGASADLAQGVLMVTIKKIVEEKPKTTRINIK